MQSTIRCLRSLGVITTLALLALATPVWGQNSGTGTGQLNVSTTDNYCTGENGTVIPIPPNKFEVTGSSVIHISISPAFPICTTGVNLNSNCSSNVDCSFTKGKCSKATTTCQTGPKSGQACSVDTDCNVAGTCKKALECGAGTCVSGACDQGVNAGGVCTSDSDCSAPVVFINSGGGPTPVTGGTFTPGNGSTTFDHLDLCYSTTSACTIHGPIGYCPKPGDNGKARFLANASIPNGGVTFGPALVRLEDCVPEIPDCTNQVGSLCCGLTQGAYGAPNSVATCSGSGCNPITGGLGYLNAGPNAFAGNPNATTIGVQGTKAVTIDDLTTLIAYLPASGTPGSFNVSVGPDTHYNSGNPIPDLNKQLGGSKGEGAGSLAGNSLACSLNSFLSGTLAGTYNGPPPAPPAFTPSGFGNFVLPAAGTLLCTKRSGPDKVLGTGDDICQAFSYPSCVAGLSVNAVLAKANSQLGPGTNSYVTCSASDLNVALDNINNQFDQCGNVIDCGTVTTPGVFTCP